MYQSMLKARKEAKSGYSRPSWLGLLTSIASRQNDVSVSRFVVASPSDVLYSTVSDCYYYSTPTKTMADPPPTNPLVEAYISFQRDNPLVTRFILSLSAASYLLSWIVDLKYALATLPEHWWEIYRWWTSPFVNSSFFTIIFAFLSFREHGKRLEEGLGSTGLAWLCFVLCTVSNVVFCMACWILYGISGSDSALLWESSGIWIILFGTLAYECAQAPAGFKRRLFVTEVPVLYYPLILVVFFAFLGGGVSLSHTISLGFGYGIGLAKGKAKEIVDQYILVGSGRTKEWEESYLRFVANQQGWIKSHAASGSGTWTQETSNESPSVRLPAFCVFSYVTYEYSYAFIDSTLFVFIKSRISVCSNSVNDSRNWRAHAWRHVSSCCFAFRSKGGTSCSVR